MECIWINEALLHAIAMYVASYLIETSIAAGLYRISEMIQCQKYFMDSTGSWKIFLWKFLVNKLIYKANFSFLREVMTPYRHALQTCSCMIEMHIYY